MVIGMPVGAQVFVGTGAFSGAVAHDAFNVDETTSAAVSVFSGVPVWGATNDHVNERVLFTTSGGTTDGADLMEWPHAGGAPTLVGTITEAAGAEIRIDGLALSNGTLYGWHQFDDTAGTAGLYEINQATLVATQVFAAASGAISGIDAHPPTGTIYAVNDTAGELQEVALNGTLTTVAAYPPSESDIDGLAISIGGLAYLIGDDSSPAEIFVYDLNGATYLTSLTSPWTGTDTFSGGAYISDQVPVELQSFSID
jgi:hypothetical protein